MDWSRAALAASVFVSAAAVSGCGGGSDADAGARILCAACPAETSTVSAAVGSVEGYWQGRSGPYDFAAVVLPGGEAYVAYALAGVIEGVMVGRAQAVGPTIFSGTVTDYNAALRSVTQGQVTGGYVTAASLSATARIGNVTRAFDARYDSSYLTEVSLDALAGDWAGTTASRDGFAPGSLRVDSSGAFTGQTPLCTVGGSLGPAAAGRAPLRVVATFSGASCPLRGRSVSGVAVATMAGARPQIIATGIAPDETDGFFALLTKQ